MSPKGSFSAVNAVCSPHHAGGRRWRAAPCGGAPSGGRARAIPEDAAPSLANPLRSLPASSAFPRPGSDVGKRQGSAAKRGDLRHLISVDLCGLFVLPAASGWLTARLPDLGPEAQPGPAAGPRDAPQSGCARLAGARTACVRARERVAGARAHIVSVPNREPSDPSGEGAFVFCGLFVPCPSKGYVGFSGVSARQERFSAWFNLCQVSTLLESLGQSSTTQGVGAIIFDFWLRKRDTAMLSRRGTKLRQCGSRIYILIHDSLFLKPKSP